MSERAKKKLGSFWGADVRVLGGHKPRFRGEKWKIASQTKRGKRERRRLKGEEEKSPQIKGNEAEGETRPYLLRGSPRLGKKDMNYQVEPVLEKEGGRLMGKSLLVLSFGRKGSQGYKRTQGGRVGRSIGGYF